MKYSSASASRASVQPGIKNCQCGIQKATAPPITADHTRRRHQPKATPMLTPSRAAMIRSGPNASASFKTTQQPLTTISSVESRN